MLPPTLHDRSRSQLAQRAKRPSSRLGICEVGPPPVTHTLPHLFRHVAIWPKSARAAKIQPGRSRSQLARRAKRPSPRLEISRNSKSPHNADPSAGGAARSAAPQAPASEKRAPNFCRLLVAERAGWPVGRAGTATSHGGLGAKYLTSTRGIGDPVGVPTHE